MIVWEYEVYDLLSSQSVTALMAGVLPIAVKVYAKVGEEGLLEDFLTEKKFAFFEPKKVEVEEDFDNFCILIVTNIKEIDLANDGGRIIFYRKPLEPSVN